MQRRAVAFVAGRHDHCEVGHVAIRHRHLRAAEATVSRRGFQGCPDEAGRHARPGRRRLWPRRWPASAASVPSGHRCRRQEALRWRDTPKTKTESVPPALPSSLGNHAEFKIGEPQAAKPFRDDCGSPSHLGHLLPKLGVIGRIAVEDGANSARRAVVTQKSLRLIAQEVLFIGEFKVHGLLPFGGLPTIVTRRLRPPIDAHGVRSELRRWRASPWGCLRALRGALAVRCANCWPAGSLALTPSARSLRRLLRRMYGSPRVCKGRGPAKAEVVAGMYPASSLGAFERPGPDGNPHTHTSHRLAVSSTLRRNRFRTCRSNLSTITSSVPRATLGSCLRWRVGRGRKLAFGHGPPPPRRRSRVTRRVAAQRRSRAAA